VQWRAQQGANLAQQLVGYLVAVYDRYARLQQERAGGAFSTSDAPSEPSDAHVVTSLAVLGREYTVAQEASHVSKYAHHRQCSIAAKCFTKDRPCNNAARVVVSVVVDVVRQVSKCIKK
jgi:hypothetical protein